jgi:ABC-type dipeptide/oligopeptide/nickel transport system permease subunit
VTWQSARLRDVDAVNPPKARGQQRPLPVALPIAARPRWRSLLRDRASFGALIVLAAVVLAAVAAPLIAPHDPGRQQLAQAFSPPTSTYLLGSDHLGRDMLSRLLHGARATLFSAVAVLTLAVLIGVAVGAFAGFCAGWVDGLLMRLTDLVLAFPALLLAVAVAGTLGQSLVHVVAALAAVAWAGFARTVRGLVLASAQQEYVLAATTLGASRRRIIVRHILPNALGPVLVLASLELGTIILSIAGLNFLGLGVQPPTAEWGAMLRAAQPHLQTDPQLVLYPSAAIVLVVLSANALADRLKGTLDPTDRS